MIKIYENLDINDLDYEIWKEILDYDGDYQVSSLGRVKSFKRCRGINCRILKQSKNKDGYFQVCLCKNGKAKYKRIHILVYETFYSDKLRSSECVHHKDEIKENNYHENLKKMAKFDHNHNHNEGINNPMFGKHFNHSEKTKMKMSKLRQIANQKIMEIKIDIEKGELTKKEMAKKHGVSQSTIYKIIYKKIYLNED